MPGPGSGAFGFDLLLADLLGDRLVVCDGLLAQPHALLGHGALLGHELLLVEHDLVLLLGDGRTGGRVADVGVADRLALDAHLLSLHGNGLLDLLGDDVLAQPRASALTLGLTHPQLLFGAGHGVVGVRAAGVAPDRVAVSPLATVAVALGQPGVRAGLRVVEPVVAVERRLFLLGELAGGLGGWGVLDLLLVIGTRTSPPASLASAIGTKLTFEPNSPVLIASHSGLPVSASE